MNSGLFLETLLNHSKATSREEITALSVLSVFYKEGLRIDKSHVSDYIEVDVNPGDDLEPVEICIPGIQWADTGEEDAEDGVSVEFTFERNLHFFKRSLYVKIIGLGGDGISVNCGFVGDSQNVFSAKISSVRIRIKEDEIKGMNGRDLICNVLDIDGVFNEITEKVMDSLPWSNRLKPISTKSAPESKGETKATEKASTSTSGRDDSHGEPTGRFYPSVQPYPSQYDPLR